MFEYGYQKERKGWSVWTLAPHTGDKRDHLRDVQTRREAVRIIESLQRNAANKARLAAVINRQIEDGRPVFVNIPAN